MKPFEETRGWFCFQRLYICKDIEAPEETADAISAALERIIKEDGYCSKWVCNAYQTGFYWICMSYRKYITKKWKSVSDLKLACWWTCQQQQNAEAFACLLWKSMSFEGGCQIFCFCDLDFMQKVQKYKTDLLWFVCEVFLARSIKKKKQKYEFGRGKSGFQVSFNSV